MSVATDIAAGTVTDSTVAIINAFILKFNKVHAFKSTFKYNNKATRIFIKRINDIKFIYFD